MEMGIAIYLQCKINDPKVLSLNIWHFIELLFGTVARIDTFLCVSFFVIVWSARAWHLIIPVGAFIFLSQIFPTVIIITNCCKQKSKNKKSPIPKIETAAQLCLVRENMMLACILDSFSIDNYYTVCGTERVLGRLTQFNNFGLQDFPQTLIHVMFLYDYSTEVSHDGFTVKLSLFFSMVAAAIALLNLVMFKPNDFDPVVLQVELKKRTEKNSKKALQTVARMMSKNMTEIANRRKEVEVLKMDVKKKFLGGLRKKLVKEDLNENGESKTEHNWEMSEIESEPAVLA